jgi:hypothetical protein
MSEVNAERQVSRLGAFGALLVTILVLTGNVSDPVNAPKFFLLGTFAFGLLAMTLMRARSLVDGILSVSFTGTLIFFVLWSVVVSFKSDSPLSQNIYGVYGRNTGLLTYVFLSIWAYSMSRLTSLGSIKTVIYGFLIAGLTNVLYCAWVIVFGDFVSWNNPYKAILGTFGNPNFISSFLGILLTVLSAFFAGASKRLKLGFVILIPILIWELLEADSLQGIVLVIFGVWLVSNYWLFTSMAKKAFSYLYFLTGFVVAGMAALGVVGYGPLVKIMAQPTVALREQYWYAAWKMGVNNPVFGVGMDSYGDWYRRMRGEGALITPGPNVVTNAAHNVYLDILAFGGFPLLLIYLAITFVGILSIIKVLRRKEKFDPFFAAIASIWATYHLQSIISINQIGLAIWGWIATGLLVSYAGFKPSEASTNLRKHSANDSDLFSPGIRGFIGLVVGAIIAVPPLSADIKWMTALKAQNVESLEQSLTGDYLSPLNSMRLAQATQTLERSGLHDLAIKYARLGVEFNPDYDDAWETLYFLKYSTPAERMKAREKLILLDPLNSEWKKLP